MFGRRRDRMVDAAERIADALEELVELSRPKQVDVEAMMVEALEALKKTNPLFRLAFERTEQLLTEGDGDAPASR